MAKLLVVDDDAPTVDYIHALLTEMGYEVVAMTSPKAAVGRAENGERFDLAVLDVVMPELSGDRLAARLRQLDPDLPVLFVTGFDEALFQGRLVLSLNPWTRASSASISRVSHACNVCRCRPSFVRTTRDDHDVQASRLGRGAFGAGGPLRR